MLHRAGRDGARVGVRWLRGEELLAGTLELDGDWRTTDVTWRMSVHDGNIGAHPGFDWAHAASDKERRRNGTPKGSMAIRP